MLHSDHMTIFVPQRKNDQYKKGHTVYILRLSGSTCPVSITENYLKMLPEDSDQHIVCRFTSSNVPQKAAISYSRVQESMLSVLKYFNIL